MLIRAVFTLTLCLTVAVPATAQIIRMPSGSGGPLAWTSASVGFFSANRIEDGTTSSVWDFGSAVQYRFSIEKSIAGGSGVGVVVGYSPMSLVYRRVGGSVSGPCPTTCNADADLWTVGATFHAGGGYGLHQIIDLMAGVNMFSDFRTADGGEPLSRSRDSDFTFSIGYGFGVGLGERAGIGLVQDYILSAHQRDGLAGNSNSLSSHYVTRLTFRLALGG